MRVYCCQIDIAWEDKLANYRKVRQMLAKAEIARGSFVVLAEMFSTGFSMDVNKVREATESGAEALLRQLAVEHGIFIEGGLVGTGRDGRPRNQAVVFGPEGEVLARYSKIHPFTLGGEAACYMAGTAIVTFKWQGCLVAPFICYDLRFPEVFRSAVQREVQLFTVIANWPIKREQHWVTLLQARAIENQAYVVGVNRSGVDPKFSYSGRSMIVDPHGETLAHIGNEEGLIQAEVDVSAVESWRKDFPALQDMHWKEPSENAPEDN
jgi:predicted amidohydrolase